MTNRNLMIQGTGSHVGKSIIVCALCRILKQDGYRVAPFKAQNMALNSFVTEDGKEMGRAQVAQAEAAGVVPRVEMNPVLLKPTGDCGSQVIIMGKPVGNMTAREYYQRKNEFVSVIKDAYDTLRNQFDIIIIEGAGSPAEINLKDDDIVNMGMAQMVSAPVLLVTDIDRGGSFAWIVGTLELLTANERNLVKGIIFNKFRGDKSILKPGLDMLEDRISKPVVGVVPYIHNLDIDDEDSVSLQYGDADSRFSHKGKLFDGNTDNTRNGFIDIVVIKLPHISNFTDFTIFSHEKDVRLRFADNVNDISRPDLLIIPGTKNTIGDLLFLRERGISEEIIKLSKDGSTIFGVCGGYQMLGRQINDPHHVESSKTSIRGMGLLNIVTTFAREKQTYQVKARLFEQSCPFPVNEELIGYEIHMGETTYNGYDSAKPFARIIERAGKITDITDGCISASGTVMGTYIHGIFDNDEFRSKLLNHLKVRKGLTPSAGDVVSKNRKEQKYQELSGTVRMNMNMNMIYHILKL
ncbi:MAG: cobyric acid synthase [Candidatus Loosdrechtia sp.]|uniref:cobyric acid synthase n=1 Tax=Candidatus Loosdrechtia sp. TaxID=3101272 RepID=UPI003A75B932|nr:MAG: cobyric acid synthase [Candidatus Jettenia sp. AMX2]